MSIVLTETSVWIIEVFRFFSVFSSETFIQSQNATTIDADFVQGLSFFVTFQIEAGNLTPKVHRSVAFKQTKEQ